MWRYLNCISSIGSVKSQISFEPRSVRFSSEGPFIISARNRIYILFHFVSVCFGVVCVGLEVSGQGNMD